MVIVHCDLNSTIIGTDGMVNIANCKVGTYKY